MQLNEYTQYDALGLAKLVATKEVKPCELAEAAFSAIDQVNPQINAVVEVLREEAAQTLETGPEDGPFSGVPFVFKDIGSHYAGIASQLGSRLFEGVVAPHDTELVARFKRSGVVTVARTSTPEFGCNVSTEPLLYGPVCNPWDTTRSAGGSSGGSAAAVAAGIVPIAHANDGGGSIRAPAANCGLVGLKPSRARVPFGPDFDEGIMGLGCELVVSRSVRDTAAMLDAVAGPDVGCRIFMPEPDKSFLNSVSRDPGRLRIGFSAAALPDGPEPDPECVRAVTETARLLAEFGHDVYEAQAPMKGVESGRVFLVLAATFMATAVDGFEAATGRTAGPDNMEAQSLKMLDYGRALKASDIAETFILVNAMSRAMGAFFETCDVWLSPVFAKPTIKLGYLNQDDASLTAEEWIDRVFDVCPYTAVFNATGQPAISLPLHWSDAGLPVGVQLVGKLAAEETLLSLAGQLENARPWSARRPPVFAE